MTQRLPHPMPNSATPPAPYRDVGELPPLVQTFLERLRRLPLGAWVDAGRRLEELNRRGTLGARRSANAVHAQLREMVDEMPHVAPRVRERVLDLVAATQGFVHPAESARMKKAALSAALALAARPALGDERFADVYEPFATIIPMPSLEDGASNGALVDGGLAREETHGAARRV